MIKANYHTHTLYCDGKDEMELFVEKGVELGLDHLGFSAHSPIIQENNFSIKMDQVQNYLDDIEKYQKEFPQIQLFKGLECDFIPGLTYPFQYFLDNFSFDYLIGGVHLVKPPHSDDGVWFIDGSKQETYDEGLLQFFNMDIKKGVTAFWEQTFEMIETEPMDIIAHLDKIKMHNRDRYFKEDEKWYLELVDHAVDLVYKHNIIVEINSRGIYKKRYPGFYPSDYILQKVAKKGIPVVISSDAHKSEELGFCYEEAKEQLKKAGIHELAYKVENGWATTSF